MIEHIVPSIDLESNGPTYSVVRLCEALIANNVSVGLSVLSKNAAQPASQSFVRRFSYGFGPTRLGQSSDLKRSLLQRAARGEISLLHNHSLWMLPNVYPGQIASKFDLPLVVAPRGTLSKWAFSSGSRSKRIFWPLLQKPNIENAACFHATAVSEVDDVRRMGFKQPVAMLPNGIDLPSLLPRQHSEARTLLFLGRIHPVKGLDMLLPAWKRLQEKHADWELQIAGPDNNGYLSQMKNLAAELGLKRIRFSGPVYGDEKWKTFSKAELYVLPSYSENFGMSVAEALGSATPCIVTKGAPWEGLDKNEAGWWVDTEVNALAEALDAAMSLPESKLTQMGFNARDWMARDYSWDSIAPKMNLVYQWILSGGPVPECVVS